MSAKPFVVISPIRAPFRSKTAFVAIVAPCENVVAVGSLFRPFSIPSSGFCGVEGTLNVFSSPPSNITKSVNVPPTSVLICIFCLQIYVSQFILCCEIFYTLKINNSIGVTSKNGKKRRTIFHTFGDRTPHMVHADRL